MNQKPSLETKEYWIFAQSKKPYPKDTPNSGKWLIFCYFSDLDKFWKKIAKATENGFLGGCSKASTARENPNATQKDTKVICVYTYDSEDKVDVARIAWHLYKLGVFTTVLNYKKDETTAEGKYTFSGERVSRYSLHFNHFKKFNTEAEFIKFFKKEIK